MVHISIFLTDYDTFWFINYFYMESCVSGDLVGTTIGKQAGPPCSSYDSGAGLKTTKMSCSNSKLVHYNYDSSDCSGPTFSENFVPTSCDLQNNWYGLDKVYQSNRCSLGVASLASSQFDAPSKSVSIS